MAQFVTIPETRLFRGMNQHIMETALPEGYVEYALNTEINSSGTISKRAGYMNYAGQLPVFTSLTQDGTDLIVTTPLGTDLSGLNSTPVYIAGVGYFPSIAVRLRKTLSAGSGTLSLGTEHGFTQSSFSVGIAECTDTVGKANRVIVADGITVDSVTNNVSLDYVASEDTDVFVYYKERLIAPTSAYAGTYSASGPHTQTITYATHQVGKTNLHVVLYEVSGDTWVEVLPDAVVVDESTGNVSITTRTAGATSLRYLIYNTDFSNSADVALPSVEGETVSAILSGISDPFIFLTVYSKSGTQLTKVIPDSIIYSSELQEYIVTMRQTDPAAQNFVLYWDTTDITTREFTVTATTDKTSAYVYGLDHKRIWNTDWVRSGWVNEIDYFASNSATGVVAGLGGSLFRAVGVSLDKRFCRLSGLTSDSRTIAPLFWDNADLMDGGTLRTRAHITHDAGQSHYSRVTEIAWQDNTTVRYTLHTPAYALQGTSDIADCISTFDKLTVESAGYKINEGVFSISAIESAGTDSIYIYITNPDREDSDWDESDCGARAGVFTDVIALDLPNEFASGDMILSSVFTAARGMTVSGASGSDLYVTVSDRVEYPLGMSVSGIRTSNIMPVRDDLSTSTTSGLVCGDAVVYANYNRNFTIHSINPTDTCDVTVVDGVASVASTTSWDTGTQLYIIDDFGVGYSVPILAILSGGSFSADLPNMTGRVIGHTIAIDETIAWTSVSTNTEEIDVSIRWVAVPSVTGTDVEPFGADVAYDQEIVRSTMARDSMFFVTPTNPTRKYDSTNYMSMGLPRWNPIRSATLDTSATADKIPVQNAVEVTVSPTKQIVGRNIYMNTSGDELKFTVGQTVIYANQIAKVTAVSTTLNAVVTDVPLNYVAGAKLNFSNILSYYFRLNYVDRNGAIVASSVVGLGDYTFQLTQSAAVKFFVSPPPTNLGQYDWDNIDLQIYRTKFDTSAPYYLVKTVRLSDLEYTTPIWDGKNEEEMTDPDYTNSSLKGQEVGTNWEAPACANCVSTIGSRLVIGNYAEHAKADIRFNQIPSGYDMTKVNITVGGRTYAYKTTKYSAGLTSTVDGYAKLTGFTQTAGTCVYLMDTDIPGWHFITAMDGADCILDVKYAGAVKSTVYFAYDTDNVPIYLGTDTNFGTRVQGMMDRLYQINYMRRTALAMNAIFYHDNSDLSADAGAEFNNDQFLITKYGDDLNSFTVAITDTNTVPIKIFINDVRADGQGVIECAPQWYPSRIALSYSVFPEIFDNVGAQAQTDSDSIIDINADDGEQITGVLPFFGKSAFGAAQTDAPLLVFKTNSVYVVDIASRVFKKLDTRGIGCNMPYSIAPTNQGVLFANSAGMWRIGRDLTLDYVGEPMRRVWKDMVNRDEIYTITGHHFGLNNKYKLSVPAAGEYQNSLVMVYDHTSEGVSMANMTMSGGTNMLGTMRGSWMMDTNLPVVGWVNVGSDEFCARNDGTVYVRRRTGTASDFRDGSEPINWSVTLRATMFGDGAVRKLVRRVIAHFRQTWGATVTCEQAMNTSNNWQELDSITVPAVSVSSGLSDNVGRRVLDVAITPDSASCISYQLRLSNNNLDEGVEFVGVDYKVAGLKSTGIVTAAGSSAAAGSSD